MMAQTKLRNILLALILHALGSKHIFSAGWQQTHISSRQYAVMKPSLLLLKTKDSDGDESTVEEYRNVATQVLSNFMQKDKMDADDAMEAKTIDFEAPKISPSTSLQTLTEALDYELTEKEWFVTGNVNPSYFSPNFRFQDPDVKVDSIEDYSKGVRKIFDQETARAEILSTVVNNEASTPERPVITITWRLSGGVNIGFGLTIKPYIVYTDFVIDPETSLVIFQEDRFDIPSWDILLSALFPFTIGKITSPPAPPAPKRDLTMPKIQLIGNEASVGGGPSMDLSNVFNGISKLFAR